MSTGTLTIDLAALCANWRSLDRLTHCETAAVIKADGYGLGAARVARALATVGCRRFFVAVAEEGAEVRANLGPGPEIYVFSGHMRGDTDTLRDMGLTPILNSLDQIARHFEATPKLDFGLQLDTGMNRLGLEWADWAQVAEFTLAQRPKLIMSHLACADDPRHPMNAYQLDVFHQMTDGFDVPRSLAATGGMQLGPEYHFDLCRPGVGLYGGLPFSDAAPVVRLDLPIIQTRRLNAGEVVGYSNSWQATRPSHIATVSAGYADGLHRAIGTGNLPLFAANTPCPIVGRVSMDLITVDITDVAEVPSHLTALGPQQTVDDVARAAGTIGYEILTSLGARYTRRSTS